MINDNSYLLSFVIIDIRYFQTQTTHPPQKN